MKCFNYENKEIKIHNGEKVVRHVKIVNGKGYKTVTKYRNGKRVGTAKKRVCNQHVGMIKIGKFVPGFFADCKCGDKKTKIIR